MTPMEELFESLPMGVALLNLSDPNDVSTWRLASIKSFASNLIAPSIETFRSSACLRLGSSVDLPKLYCEVVGKRRPRTLGIFESRGSATRNDRPSSMVSAFPADTRRAGILFEDVSGRSGHALAESSRRSR